MNTLHELRVLPVGLGGAAMRRNDLNTRTRALRLARDSVARYAKTDALQRIQRVWNRDQMQRETIADKQGWAPAADDTAEGLKGHTLDGSRRTAWGGGRTERYQPIDALPLYTGSLGGCARA